MGKIGKVSSGLAAILALAVPTAFAQSPSTIYDLTRPAWNAPAEWDGAGRQPMVAWGPVRLGTGFSPAGAGLSMEAGERWFARVGVGRSVDSNELSLGGGYRWGDGQALSLQVVRGLGQERLGLAVRYDWPQYYLRFGYDTRLGPASPESLRFSAGIRF